MVCSTQTISYSRWDAALEKKDLNVAILGGGPAGLSSAIVSLIEGANVVIIEKREEGYKGRENSVRLEAETIQLLELGHIYSNLLKKGLVRKMDSAGNLSIRLCDLENALREAVLKLGGVIHYGNAVQAIDESRQKVSLHLNTGVISQVDVVVNAEGAKSSTNQLLGNRRIEVLPKVAVIAATMKDGRKITGFCSFFGAIFKTITYTAAAIYQYVVYFFRVIFCCNGSRGAILLKTPGQHYLGVALDEKRTEQLAKLYQEAKRGGAKEKARLDSYARKWTYVAFSQQNVRAFFSKIFCKKRPFQLAGWRPLNTIQVVEIGADNAEHSLVRKGRSVFLIIGDALVTVDPVTGLGCNAAIQGAGRVMNFLKNPSELNFTSFSKGLITHLHEASQYVRNAYSS